MTDTGKKQNVIEKLKHTFHKVIAMPAELIKKDKNEGEAKTDRSGNEYRIFGVVLCVVVITVLLMMAVSNSVTLNEYTREVARLKRDVGELEVQVGESQLELDKKNNYVAIEEYAYYNLGMIKSSQSTSDNSASERADSIEAYAPGESGNGVIITILSALFDNFGESWNNLTGGE